MSMREKSLVGGLRFVALVAYAGVSAFADVTSVPPGGTLIIDDTRLSKYADGIVFAATTAEKPVAGVVKFNTTSAPTISLSGFGTVRKVSTSDWTLSTAQPNFTGDFRIDAGVVTCTHAIQLGALTDTTANTGAVYVASGAALNLNITTGTTANDRFAARRIHIAGPGCGDYKALHLTKVPSGAMTFLILDDDATLYVADNENHYWLTTESGPTVSGSNRGRLFTNGHTLTKSGAMTFNLLGLDVYGNGRIIVAEGSTSLRDSFWLLDGCDTYATLELLAGRAFKFWNHPTPIPGTLQIDGASSFLTTVNNNDPNHYKTNTANWAGPVKLVNEESVLTVNPSNNDRRDQLTISGSISGPGSVVIGASKAADGRGRVAFAGTNTYTGTTTVYAGLDNLFELYRPESIPDLTKTTVEGRLLVRGFSGESGAWKTANFWEYLNTVNFGPLGGFALDCTTCADSAWTLSVNEFNARVTRAHAPFGSYAGTLTMTAEAGTTVTLPRLSVIGGTNIITGAATFQLSGTNAVGWASSSKTTDNWDDAPVLRIEGGAEVLQGRDPLFAGQPNRLNYVQRAKLFVTNATWRSASGIAAPTANWTGQISDTVLLGAGDGYAVLEIQKDGVFSNKFICGLTSYVNSGAGVGAVYVKDGGALYTLLNGSRHLTSALGMATYGHGYLQVEPGATVRNIPSVGTYGVGVAHFYGGTVTCDADFELGNCNQGCGTVYLTNTVVSLAYNQSNIRMGLGQNNHTTLILDAGGKINSSNTLLGMGSVESQKNVVSLMTGGRLQVYRINSYKKASECQYTNPFVFNFEGGELAVQFPSEGVMGDKGTMLPKYVVGAAGGTISVGKSTWTMQNDAEHPLTSEKSNGIVAVNWPHGEVALSCAPIVKVTAGGGYGAAFVADWDPVRRVLKGVKVCSPGWGYDASTVSISVNSRERAWTLKGSDVTVGDTETGGMTFAGAGTVVLNATNAWEKWTGLTNTVVVKVMHGKAIPSGTALRFGGGTLDLNGLGDEAPTFTTLSGTGGKVTNGSLKLVGAAGSADTIELSAKQFVAGQTCVVDGTLDLSDVTTINLTDAGLLADWRSLPHSAVLFSATDVMWPEGGITFTGVPAGWRMVRTEKGVRLVHPMGLHVIVR